MAEARALAVIPSRWAAQRFPGKPLALIGGKPMVQWVWEAARRARRVSRVVVATDDPRIARAVRSFGGEAVMTPRECPSGTDRVARVARSSKAAIVVNVQGDEPLLAPQTIDRVVEALEADRTAVMSTAVRAPESRDEWLSPDVVKAVLDRRGRALYFSRAPIPYPRAGDGRAPRWVHMGLYGFRRAFLLRFAALAPTSLEETERLEQLRALEHGGAIQAVRVRQRTSCGVDRPADVKRVEKILARSHARK